MSIPIQNFYYLLAYAWNKLDELESMELDLDSYSDAVNLFGRVLVTGCNYVLKRGLDRAYLNTQEDYPGIKGKLNIHESFSRQLFNQGKTNCSFDEFTSNVLHNRVLKSTLRMIANLDAVDKNLRHEAWRCFHRFQGVEELDLSLRHFSLIHLHGNNAHYDLPLNVARFLIENIVFDAEDGEFKFRDFSRDDKAMAALFEEFVRNFYLREQNNYSVRREDIKWQVSPLFGSDYYLLPKMQTDISLESPTHKLVIDTKFYTRTSREYFGVEKFHASNLYQLHAYLTNLEKDSSNPRNHNCDGMLLYPRVDRDYDSIYRTDLHTIRVKTLNLEQSWEKVHEDLIGIISFYNQCSLSTVSNVELT